VARVAPEVTLPLRARILRYGAPPPAARQATDDHPAAAAFAATTAAGDVVGTAVTAPEPRPWDAGEEDAWCLRGMATAPAWRGRGVGALVVAALVDHVRAQGGRIVWCRARVPARRFYERAGFTAHGDEWTDPDHGPHIAMWRDVTLPPDE
jgi:GNAT superfamily N-acetyltransferase